LAIFSSLFFIYYIVQDECDHMQVNINNTHTSQYVDIHTSIYIIVDDVLVLCAIRERTNIWRIQKKNTNRYTHRMGCCRAFVTAIQWWLKGCCFWPYYTHQCAIVCVCECMVEFATDCFWFEKRLSWISDTYTHKRTHCIMNESKCPLSRD
jgi:hypothetical protein